MKHLFFCVIFTLSTVLSQAATMSQVDGSGQITTDHRNLQPFHEVRISGKAQVFLIQGNTTSIIIEGDDNIVPIIESTVNNNVLSVSPPNQTTLFTKLPLIYKITTPHLDFIQLTGSSDLKSDGELHSDSFGLHITGAATADLVVYTTQLETDISGSGRVNIGGTCQKVGLAISGSGKFMGEHLRAKEAHIRISGSGSAQVNALDILNVSISGNGKVFYKGTPKIYKKITGSGTLIQVQDETKRDIKRKTTSSQRTDGQTQSQ